LKRKNSRHFKTNPERNDRPTGARPPVVLGVDPGTLVTGFGVVSSGQSHFRLLACGSIRNNPRLSLPERLTRIHAELARIIQLHQPDEFAIECAFYGKNAQSALKLGQARGVLILAAMHHGVPVSEYTPREIKKAVTGNGNASKPQIRYMVQSLLGSRDPMNLDTADAIAAGICHLQRLNRQRKSPKDWKSFVTLHPERVVS
jgi:crossover junction endodeoxyribonuclease RuvC